MASASGSPPFFSAAAAPPVKSHKVLKSPMSLKKSKSLRHTTSAGKVFKQCPPKPKKSASAASSSLLKAAEDKLRIENPKKYMKYPDGTKPPKHTKYLIHKPLKEEDIITKNTTKNSIGEQHQPSAKPVTVAQVQQHCGGSVTTRFNQQQPLGDFGPWSSLETPTTTFNLVQNQPLISNDPFLTTTLSCSSPLGPSVAAAAAVLGSSPSASPSRVALDQQRDLTELWSPEALFEDLYNPMVCCNPREVEGIAARSSSTEFHKEEEEKEIKVEKSSQVVDAQEEASDQPNLGVVVEESSSGPSSSLIKQEFLEPFEENLFQQQQPLIGESIATPQEPPAAADSIPEPEMMDEDFDLMEFVGDDAIPVNHPDFLELLVARPLENTDIISEVVTSHPLSPIDGSAIGIASAAATVVQPQPVPSNATTVIPAVVTQVNNDFFVTVANDVDQQQVVPFQPEEPEIVQEPVVPAPAADSFGERPPVHKVEEIKEEEEEGVSNDDHAYGMRVAHQRAPRKNMGTPKAKYRRMRDLNNEASKRCRQNRKLKINDLLMEEEELKARNRELNVKFELLQEQVTALKKLFLHRVVNPPVQKQQQPVQQQVQQVQQQQQETFDLDEFVKDILEKDH